MRWRDNVVLIMVIGITISIVAAISTYSGGGQVGQPAQQQHARNEKMEEQANRLPIADYNEPEPSDPQELERRREKGTKYDKPEVTVDAYSEVVVGSMHWANGLPAFPVERSSAVVIGTVTDAKARMSNNKKGVYSEFSLRVEEVLKIDGDKSLKPKSNLAVDREGGRVRLPSGKVGIYYISGQGMPLVGRRYVLFLSCRKSIGFTILTGYEIHEGKVSPLDNPGGEHPFTKYDGADEQSFLEELRIAVANSQADS